MQINFEVKLLEQCGFYLQKTSSNIENVRILSLSSDSNQIQNYWGFIARDGHNYSAVDFLSQISNKFACVFIDIKHKHFVESHHYPNLVFFYSNNFSKSISLLLRLFYKEPYKGIKMVAVTGTNGKTTITYSLYIIFQEMGYSSAYIGTNGCFINKKKIPTSLTTSDLFFNYKFLQNCHENGVQYCFIEASSHGIQQERLLDIEWDITIFTNLSKEHIDYHKNMVNYYKTKSILFKKLVHQRIKKKPIVIINTDDYYSKQLYIDLQIYYKFHNKGIPIITIDKSVFSSVYILQWESNIKGYSFRLKYNSNIYYIPTNMIGFFNIYNIASVFMTSLFLKQEPPRVIEKIAKLQPDFGRMEIINTPNGGKVIIDYAHTPDGLLKILKTAKEIKPRRIILIFGCGGNRYQKKRKMMGKIANRNADFIILTNDNPRKENPLSIISDIKSGINTLSCLVILDRRQAIHCGLRLLKKDEILIIAGKGNEKYQILQDKKIKFQDTENVRSLLKNI